MRSSFEQALGKLTGFVGSLFLLQGIDQIDRGKEPYFSAVMLDSLNAKGGGNMAFAVVLWVVMHAAIALTGHQHPDYRNPDVVIGGVMSHLFFAVPLAWVVRSSLSNKDNA